MKALASLDPVPHVLVVAEGNESETPGPTDLTVLHDLSPEEEKALSSASCQWSRGAHRRSIGIDLRDLGGGHGQKDEVDMTFYFEEKNEEMG